MGGSMGQRLARRGFAPRSLIAAAAVLSLSGCYIPTEGIREPNPGPTASPPWPYEEGARPPARSAWAVAQSGMPGDAVPSGSSRNTPPPPSQSVPPQYPDWLFDGPEGRGFAFYLSQGYRRYAKHEDNAHDFEDAAKFLFRAGAVDRGEHVEPEQLTMRILPEYAVDDLQYARHRLMQALGRGAAQRLPKLAANAQVAFDCWMEQQEENLQPHDVARCRRDFEAFIVRLEEPPLRPQPACTSPACLPAAPCAVSACDSTPLLIHFELDKHELPPSAAEIIRQAAERAKNAAGPITVGAHADRSGSERYNDALSKRRLDSVMDALVAAGVPRERLNPAEFFGEARPRVPTADGVREPENRRVEIRLSCGAPPEAPRCAPAVVSDPGCGPKDPCAAPTFSNR